MLGEMEGRWRGPTSAQRCDFVVRCLLLVALLQYLHTSCPTIERYSHNSARSAPQSLSSHRDNALPLCPCLILERNKSGEGTTTSRKSSYTSWKAFPSARTDPVNTIHTTFKP